MKFSEVKSLFMREFCGMGMSAYDMRNTWVSFVGDLFDGGIINARVYQKCISIA